MIKIQKVVLFEPIYDPYEETFRKYLALGAYATSQRITYSDAWGMIFNTITIHHSWITQLDNQWECHSQQ